MKGWKRTLLAVVITVCLSTAGAYGLVTARSFPEVWRYHQAANFLPLLLSTAAFLWFYNAAVQLTMYFWYKWSLDRQPYYITKLFPRPVILLFTTVLLLFIEFVLGLRDATLESSGYMDVEFPLFQSYFMAFVILTIRYPASNPWYNLVSAAVPQPRPVVKTIAMQHKQETLHLTFADLPVLIFIRKKCIGICNTGRQMYSTRLNSAAFKKTAASRDYVQINRNGYVRREVIEGFSVENRDRFLVFLPQMQDKINAILETPDEYTMSWDRREIITKDHFKISGMYLNWIKAVLDERELKTA